MANQPTGWSSPKKVVKIRESPPADFMNSGLGIIMYNLRKITLPETNIAPENRSSQTETSIPTIHSQGLC